MHVSVGGQPPSEEQIRQQWLELQQRTKDSLDHMTPAQRDYFDKATPQERAAYGLTPPTWEQFHANAMAGYAATEKALENGTVLTNLACTVAPFFDAGKEIYGTVARQCAKTFQVSGAARHIHISCPALSGVQVTDDYDRIDSENFKGARQKVTVVNQAGPDGAHTTATNRTTWVGKWTGEASPHMPHIPPPTDLDGVRPKGPLVVTVFDPYRIVAVIDGKQIIAPYAYLLLNLMRPGTALRKFGPGPASQLQQIYLRDAVAVEAFKMHLGTWDGGDLCTGSQGAIHCGSNVGFDPSLIIANSFGDVSDAQVKMDNLASMLQRQAELYDSSIEKLWNAYFNRAKTEAEKQTLLHKVQEKYKLTVTDPDFFRGQTTP